MASTALTPGTIAEQAAAGLRVRAATPDESHVDRADSVTLRTTRTALSATGPALNSSLTFVIVPGSILYQPVTPRSKGSGEIAGPPFDRVRENCHLQTW
jgi:hypothetical protein